MRTRLRRSHLLVGLAIVLAMFLVLTPFVVIPFQIERTIEDLEHEAVTMTPVIDAVYEYRSKNGAWPTKLDGVIREFTAQKAQIGWHYSYSPPPYDAADLTLRGPLHSRVAFVFCSPSHPDLTPGWFCTMEGDTVPFDVSYQPD